MAGDAFTVELALDRVEAELAGELPRHMREFARRYAGGAAAPAAPAVLHQPATLAPALAARRHPALAARGEALLRLVAPIAIEDDPAVIAARARPPSWAALAQLTVARDAAALVRFGRRAIEVMHALHGAATVPAPAALPPAIAGWTAPDGVEVTAAAIARVWAVLASRHGVAGDLDVVRGDAVRPRAFLVEPGRAVTVVLPAEIATPADRFAVLHELGHAVAGLGSPAAVPRALDEAMAARVARGLEDAGSPWFSPLATAARHRRRALAAALDEQERALPRFTAAPEARPPWALWHDPGAQAAYVAAEDIADTLPD